jgi:uncharacterized protein (DUF1684 family)
MVTRLGSIAVAAVMIAPMGLFGQSQKPPAPADYLKRVEAWRAAHEVDYRRDYVPLAGLFYLEEGPNAAGSAPGSRVQLPARAPATIGRFIHQSSGTRFEPAAGVRLGLNGKPLTAAVTLRPDGESEAPDEIQVGDIGLWIHMSGERRAIRMRDPQSETARTFTGFKWFPVDARYRIVGKFIKDPAPKDVLIPSLSGDDQTYTTEGLVEFTFEGQTVRMRPMTTRPNRFFFIFRDATAGNETYEAARFLYADLLPDGTTVLDFNEAYNPPCAFNPFTTCPLPPAENRLTMRLLAGERNYVEPGR